MWNFHFQVSSICDLFNYSTNHTKYILIDSANNCWLYCPQDKTRLFPSFILLVILLNSKALYFVFLLFFLFSFNLSKKLQNKKKGNLKAWKREFSPILLINFNFH